MRRLTGLALSALLALALLAAPAAASPAHAATDDVLVLAVEGDGGPVGPDPQDRTAENNRATELIGYEDPETPFTWGAAWILTFAGFVGLMLLIGLYYLLVQRPAQEGTGSR